MFSANTTQVSQNAVFIEDTFSCFLYTGNSPTQTITNGIDLAGKGGLVWVKQRDVARSNFLTDTLRGAGYSITSNDTAAQVYDSTRLTAFSSNGFSVGSSSNFNNSGQTYASWTFRKQPKFFDVVTYTGTGSTQTINHNLGSVPGCIIVKCTSTTTDWCVHHIGLGGPNYTLRLNTTAAKTLSSTQFAGYNPTATDFKVGTATETNTNGATYVAYLFAHNAGGFGLTGTDNVISCGSYTGNGSSTGPVIDLGYEPQWLLVKQSSIAGANWVLVDNMRGLTAGGSNAILYTNSSNSEASASPRIGISSTGFQPLFSGYEFNQSGETYIYIAIRRGPMKVPTDGTKVFAPVATQSSGLSATQPLFNAGFPVDMVIRGYKLGATSNGQLVDRLRGGTVFVRTPFPDAETSTIFNFGSMIGPYLTGAADATNSNICGWNFRRAPSFFDEVCWTGDATEPRAINHNLTASPELLIIKKRSAALDWWVMTQFTSTAARFGNLNLTDAVGLANYTDQSIIKAQPTSTTFTVGNSSATNQSGATYVAYLFASCPGVSKVGSYTGNGGTQTINCGFAGGARFVLIKRTDSTGDWYVYDTARGMTTLTDPYLLLNSTAAESATLGSVTTVTTGFAVNASILAAINTNAASYIFLAIA